MSGSELRDTVPRKVEAKGDDHPSTLHTDAWKKDEKTGETKQDVAQASDRIAQGDATKQRSVDPYEHIDKAKEAGNELDLLLKQGRKPDEMITVRDNGQLKEVRVADRVADLKKQIADEIKIAGDAAKAINQQTVDKMLEQNRDKRDQMAKDLGLKPEELTPEKIDEEYQKAKGNADRQQKLRELVPVVGQRDALNLFHYAPLSVKLVEGEFRSRGFLDANLKMGDPVPASEFKRALDELRAVRPGSDAEKKLFGAGNEVAQAVDLYNNSEQSITLNYGLVQQKQAERVALELNQANGPNKEQHLKEALRLADQLDVPFLVKQAVMTENLQSGIGAEMIDMVRMGSMARLKNAEYLVSQGKIKEAQGLMMQVKSDSPELLYQKDEATGVISYRKHPPNDTTYEKLDRAVNVGISVNPATFGQMQSALFENIKNDKFGTTENGKKFLDDMRAGKFKSDDDIVAYMQDHGTGIEALKMMKVCREKYKIDIAESNAVLDKELVGLNSKFQQYDKRATDQMTEPEKAEKARLKGLVDKADTPADQKLEAQKQLTQLVDSKLTIEERVDKARVERQINGMNVIKEDRQKFLNRIDALTDFTEGAMHLCQGGARSAHDLFKSALEKDPELDKEFAALKQNTPDLETISDLIKKTDDTWEGYKDRNGKKFAKAAGIAAATLTGNLVLGLFSRASVLSGVATIGSAGLAGGLTNYAIARSVDPRAGYAEIKEGAFDGMMMGALSWTPWAAQISRVGQAGEAAAMAKTGWVTNLASKAEMLGVTKGTVAMGFGITGASELADVIVDGKPVTRALQEFGLKGLMNTGMVSVTRKWGLAPAAGESAVASRMGLAGRLGINKVTVGIGVGVAAVPQIQNALEGKGVDPVEFGKEAAINTAAFAFFKRWGVDDPKAMAGGPTLASNLRTGGRVMMMQEAWNVGIDRIMKTGLHDVLKQPFYIGKDGLGFTDSLIADAWGQYFAGLDASHPGDRRIISDGVDQHGTTFGGTFKIDKKVPNPRNGTGIFYDYSKKPDKPPEK